MDGYIEKDGVTDFAAIKVWNEFPEKVRDMFLNNAFCSNCLDASFAPGYNLHLSEMGEVVIKGNCSTCGETIVRVCD
ncbi:hypothetical protein HZY88_06770 [Aerococcaceae bacterium DSM 111176]|nr:hypothetical protein [Aerococcaceae bacterium DSM 111176]